MAILELDLKKSLSQDFFFNFARNADKNYSPYAVNNFYQATVLSADRQTADKDKLKRYWIGVLQFKVN